MEKIRVGVVGTGFIGGKHIEAIARIPQAALVAITDSSAARRQEVAERYQVHGYQSVEEMLDRESLDVVHNCTPTSMHYFVNEKVLLAHKHLYCEKPLALDAAEGEKLQQLAERQGVANGVNLNYRMNALVQHMHDLVQDGQAGRSFLVTGSYIQDWMMMQDDYDWRLDPKVGGVSRAIADIGSHLFDTCQFVLGKRITAVNAHLTVVHPIRCQYEKAQTFSKEKGRLLREAPVVNEDAASIMARFEDGTEGLFQVSQISAGHKNDMRLRFDFERCSYEWRQEESNLLYIGHRDEPNQILQREAAALSPRARRFTGLPAGHPEGWNDALYQAVNAFYQSILTDTWRQETPYATIAEGAWIMKIIDACLASGKQGRWIDVATGGAV